MASNYTDFDAQAELALPGAPTVPTADPRTRTEAVAIAVKTALRGFISETLPLLNQEQLGVLVSHLPVDLLPAAGQSYDANFSIKDELSLQIQAVQALRQHVFPGGKLKEGASVREAKEVATTCNQMLKTLMDSHERIMNMERMRAVEAATLEVLAELDEKLREKFLLRLELKLEEIE